MCRRAEGAVLRLYLRRHDRPQIECGARRAMYGDSEAHTTHDIQ